MALNLNDKKTIVAQVAEVAASAYSAVAAEYRGLTVADMTDLRRLAREKGVYVRVVKNTLARRAVTDTDFACMQDIFVGPLILAFSREDLGSAARIMGDFAKKHDKLVIKGVSISGKLLPPSELETVAKMPTYEEAISMLMSVMQAPIGKFVRTLAEPHAKLVRTIAAVREQKEAA